MESKYTKGEWINDDGLIMTEDKSKTIASVNFGISQEQREEFEGNCNLIAAAPLLLEILIDIHEGCERDKNIILRPMEERIREAILKATSI